tara:strand:- start:196 stop:636 length:441 start_codon:yes stop_codon:yes gene_type:complete
MNSHDQPKDVVIDANIMCFFDKPNQPEILKLFKWLKTSGTLAVSRKLVNEYMGCSSRPILILINYLSRVGRYHLYSNKDIDAFKLDRHYNYTCNRKDISHARLVFLSFRKRLITSDRRLANDVNKFKRIKGIKACACGTPISCCLN